MWAGSVSLLLEMWGRGWGPLAPGSWAPIKMQEIYRYRFCGCGWDLSFSTAFWPIYSLNPNHFDGYLAYAWSVISFAVLTVPWLAFIYRKKKPGEYCGTSVQFSDNGYLPEQGLLDAGWRSRGAGRFHSQRSLCETNPWTREIKSTRTDRQKRT